MDSPSTGDLRRCGALLTTGWTCSSGSPNESAKPTAQLTALHAELNRVRAIAFLSQDYRCSDSRGVASIRVRTIGVGKKVVLARRHVNWRAELPIRPGDPNEHAPPLVNMILRE